MTEHLEERRVRELMDRAVVDLTGPRAPLAAVLEGGRRRRRAKRVAATGVLAAAAACAVVATLLHPAAPGPAPAAVPVIDGRAGTVTVGGLTVTAPDGWRIDTRGRCATEQTLVVLEGVGVTGCGRGPSIVVSRKVSADWPISAPGELRLVGGAPVWLAQGQQAFLSIPYAHVYVELDGTWKQRAALLKNLAIDIPAADAVRRQPVVAAAVDRLDGTGPARTITDRASLAAASDALSRAPAVPASRWCVPDPDDQVVVTLQTTAGSDPDHDPVGDFTSVITAFSGDCRLAYSSTGAVVRPGAAFFQALGGPLRAG